MDMQEVLHKFSVIIDDRNEVYTFLLSRDEINKVMKSTIKIKYRITNFEVI